MSASWKSLRKNSLCHYCCCCHHHRSHPGKNDPVVLFIFLVGIAFLVAVFPFHVYLFVCVYFYASLFYPHTAATKTATAASRKKTIPIPVIPLWNNYGCIFPYFNIRNPSHLIWWQNLPPHNVLVTYLPAYLLWQHWLQPQLRWGQKWFPAISSCPVLYILSLSGASVCKKSLDSLGRGFPPLPIPPPLN